MAAAKVLHLAGRIRVWFVQRGGFVREHAPDGAGHGATVLTNAAGFTLYWFGPDTTTASKCTGSCASFWPPVKGPVTAGAGVTGKLGTITGSDGSVQATCNGHPLYTYTRDTAAGQDKGNALNASGGVWHEVTVSGAAAPGSSPSASSGGYEY